MHNNSTNVCMGTRWQGEGKQTRRFIGEDTQWLLEREKKREFELSAVMMWMTETDIYKILP